MANLLTKQELAGIIGSWHPRGYHGHSRSKSRTEFADNYRKSAKPVPPEKFRTRQRDDVLSHTFSKHDNKQIFLNDPLLFGSGIGKKKIDSVNKNKWNPEFMGWSDDQGRERLKRSVYQKDFCLNPNNTKLLTARKSLDSRPVSVYACNFGNDNEPTIQNLRDNRKETYFRFINKNRAKSCVGERLSVANCMVWNDKITTQPRQENNNEQVQTET